MRAVGVGGPAAGSGTVARDENRGLIGSIAATLAGEEGAGVHVEVGGLQGPAVDHQVSGRVTDAVPHEVRGRDSDAVPHEVRGRDTDAVPHEVRGRGTDAVVHRVDPVSLQVPPVAVHVATEALMRVRARIPADFTLALRVFGREVARLELSGSARLVAEEIEDRVSDA
jgi:hypothetical protein